jgi:hypothetical protein
VAAVKRVPWEVRAVLALIVLDGIAVIATYSRFPTSLLYNVDHSDTVAAGFRRELVALNFPFALVGIALVGLAWPTPARVAAQRREPDDRAVRDGVLRGRPVGPRRQAAERSAGPRACARRRATMLSLTALAFSRLPRPRILDAYLALMLAYGIGNLVNDDWLEQVVKRGWTRHEVPSLPVSAANWGWAVVLVGAIVIWRLWFRQPSRTTPAPASPAISSSA